MFLFFMFLLKLCWAGSYDESTSSLQEKEMQEKANIFAFLGAKSSIDLLKELVEWWDSPTDEFIVKKRTSFPLTCPDPEGQEWLKRLNQRSTTMPVIRNLFFQLRAKITLSFYRCFANSDFLWAEDQINSEDGPWENVLAFLKNDLAQKSAPSVTIEPGGAS